MLNEAPIDRSFEKFIGGPTPDRGAVIRITLNRQGHIYLNAKAYELLGKPPSVYLYYSPEKDQILVERTEWRLTLSFPFGLRSAVGSCTALRSARTTASNFRARNDSSNQTSRSAACISICAQWSSSTVPAVRERKENKSTFAAALEKIDGSAWRQRFKARIRIGV